MSCQAPLFYLYPPGCRTLAPGQCRNIGCEAADVHNFDASDTQHCGYTVVFPETSGKPYSQMFISTYIRHAFKSLTGQGYQSVISAAGFSIALTCSILIIVYAQYEFSYDNYHKNADHIFRIVSQQPGNSYMGKDLFAVTPGLLKEALVNEIPEVKNAARCSRRYHTLEYETSLFEESGFLYADPDLLKIFSFPVISGNPAEDLNEPFTIFITRDMALKYFGREDPTGKILKADNTYLFVVRGVLENIPQNSHFHFDFLCGFETLYSIRGGRDKVENWNSFSFTTYILLNDNVTAGDIDAKLKELSERHLSENAFFKKSYFFAQPLGDIHLDDSMNFDIGNNTDIRYIYLTLALVILIILIACFNYVNMATARSYNRGRETGVLKVSGAGRGEIILQIVMESVLLSFAGFILALIIAASLMPLFSDFTERPLTCRMIFEYRVIAKAIALTLATGLVSGIYPALHLSSVTPVNLINENYKSLGSRRSGRLRNLLVVVQNIISVVALICTFTVLRQLRFIDTSDIGFEKENIITVEVRDPEIMKNPGALLNELRANPAIIDITTSATLPVSTQGASYALWEGKPEETRQFVYKAGTGNNFLDFYDLKIVSGRGFSDDFPADTINSFIINETAAGITGMDDPVGKKFGFNKEASMGTIIGVVEDFHFQSLHLPVEPLAISAAGGIGSKALRYISVKVTPGTISGTLPFVSKVLKEFSPHYLNPVSVFSDQVDNMYRSERKLAAIFVFSTVLALLLACLGQFSLASYTTRSRTREMVVRKIMGAQPAEVMILITVQIAKWIFVSMLFAWPAAYLLITKWLQGFSSHVSIGAGVFIISLAIILLISLLAISYHILKLSRVNPAEMLRHD